ncbi:MAG: phosphoketolase family protein [Christensenellaceae bacterium]|jgi:xylulose-5-phosphate/fructose-6-phosphate phosphoketolase|nr:phosphoketolase family protein [Christensenellaceae bacterium]
MNYNSKEYFATLDRYFRCANYLTASQLYLLDNPLLKRPLNRSDIKNKIVGHWGTCPGQNFLYTHLNRAINKYNQEVCYISGPGHGGNFFISNAYIEGTYSEFYPQITKNEEGLKKLFKQFSFAGGVSSHVAPEIPGSMHEGGELGYSLAHGFGVVMDKPNLIACVCVGDGEAETGPLAASWFGTKFINPKTDGAVLPVLHLNGYKIANPTLLARISKEERANYFSALGYEPVEVEVGYGAADDHEKMAAALDTAIQKIHKIWEFARNGKAQENIKYPMIIMNSPKGWGGVKVANNQQIEGSFRAHQVPVDMSKPEHVGVVSNWLWSYKPNELFNPDGTIQSDILGVCPKGNLRISANPISNPPFVALNCPNVNAFAVPVQVSARGKILASDMQTLSLYIEELMKRNPTSFRFFSPDETKSNRIYAPFNISNRIFEGKILPTDEALSQTGRFVDSILSEHFCEGALEGYVLSGRNGFFASYESFARVADSMIIQHAKWLNKISRISWRNPLPALNIIATSHVWQQDHNGYTHQDPGLATTMLEKNTGFINAYYPIDANSLLAVYDKCSKSKNVINIITASKHQTRQWLTIAEATELAEKGVAVLDWAGSCGKNETPDLVMACCGDTPTREVIASVRYLKNIAPEVKVRVVCTLQLNKLDSNLSNDEEGLTEDELDEIFTTDKPILFSFHGYPQYIRGLLASRENYSMVIGYQEEGEITTGFDMCVLNNIDRFNVAHYALMLASLGNKNIKYKKEQYDDILNKVDSFKKYIHEFGVDPDWVLNF